VREFYGWRDKFGENSGLFSLFLVQYPEIESDLEFSVLCPLAYLLISSKVILNFNEI
jgi:hypothetical protein